MKHPLTRLSTHTASSSHDPLPPLSTTTKDRRPLDHASDLNRRMLLMAFQVLDSDDQAALPVARVRKFYRCCGEPITAEALQRLQRFGATLSEADFIDFMSESMPHAVLMAALKFRSASVVHSPKQTEQELRTQVIQRIESQQLLEDWTLYNRYNPDAHLINCSLKLLQAEQVAIQEALASCGGEAALQRLVEQVQEQVPGEVMVQPVQQCSDNQWREAQLAHDVLLYPSLKVEPKEVEEVEEYLQGIAKRTFWDLVMEDVNADDYGRLLRLLQEANDTLQQVPIEHPNLRLELHQAMDLQFIEKALKNKCFDSAMLADMVHFTFSRIGALQPPEMDQQQRRWLRSILPALRQCNTPVQVVRLLPEVLDCLFAALEFVRCHSANRQLQALRSEVLQQPGGGVQYQRDIFDRLVVDGCISLEHTQQWLATCLQQQQQQPPQHQYGTNGSCGSQDVRLLVQDALCQLVVCYEPVEKEQLPETLQLDSFELANLQLMAVSVVRVVVQMLHLQQELREAWIVIRCRRKVQQLKQQLWEAFFHSSSLSSACDKVLELRLRMVRAEGRQLSEEEVLALSDRIQRQTSVGNVLHQTVTQKLLSVFQAAMRDKATLQGKAVEAMAFMGKELELLCDELSQLAHRDWCIHSHHYIGLHKAIQQRLACETVQ